MTGIDILVRVAPRITGTPTCSIVEAINTVLPLVSARLVHQRSRWSRSLQSITVLEGVGYFSIPAAVGGITCPLRLIGGRSIVPVPLGVDLTSDALTVPGIPVYYEVYGSRVALYPPNSTDIEILVPLQSGVLPVTSESSTLPWDGVFDSFLVEACYLILANGLAVCATPEFQGLLASAVDFIVAAEKIVAEQEFVDRTWGYPAEQPPTVATHSVALQGVITDTSTGKTYRLVVTDGVFGLEEVV